jgi:hypothetical protein
LAEATKGKPEVRQIQGMRPFAQWGEALANDVLLFSVIAPADADRD